MPFSPVIRNAVNGIAAVPATALGVDLLTGLTGAVGCIDALQFQTVNFELIGDATAAGGSLVFEQTNDKTNTTWQPLPLLKQNSLTIFSFGSALASNRILYSGPLQCRYVRVRLQTPITAGTVKVEAVFSPDPYVGLYQIVYPTSVNLGVTIGSVLAPGAIMQNLNNGVITHSNAKIVSAAGLNLTNVKATTGRVYGWSLTNTTAANKSVKLFNTAVAPIAAATPQMNIIIPPNGHIEHYVVTGHGLFALGIGYAITGGITDTDATAVVANDVVGSLYYI
jgi:hypothetical protein